jgi:hypothetical protein
VSLWFVVSSPNRKNALVWLFLGAASLLFASPALVDFANWGVLDWDFQLHHHAVPRLTILDYGELPLWNPFNRSGVPMLAHPESRVLSPTFLLTLLFGEVAGLKLELLLHLMIGLTGVYALLRHWGTEPIGSVAAAFVFVFNSSFAIHLTVGHVWALSFAWLPWVLLAYERSLDDARYSLAVSGILVIIFFSGAPYPFMVSWLMLGCHALFTGIAARSLAPPTRLLSLVVLQVVLLSAIKLLPTAELMSAFPRSTPAESGYTLSALGNALLDPHQVLASARAERPEEFNGTPLHEGAYVGFVAAGLCLVGALARGRRGLASLAMAVLFFWISLGQHAPVDLWKWIHPFPGFDNMRMVQRFAVVGVLFLSVFAGFGVAAIARVNRAAALGAAALLLVELMIVNRPVFRDAFAIAPIAVEQSAEFEQLRALPYYDQKGWIEGRPPAGLPAMTSLYPAVLSKRGSTLGYFIVPFVSHAAPSGAPSYRGEVYLESGAAASYASWSPNRLEVELAEAARRGESLFINQNYDSGWIARATDSDTPRLVDAHAGLIRVALLPGDRRIELRYRPRSFTIGAAISFAGALGFFAWGAWPWLRRARRSDP